MGENSKIEWTHHTFNPWIGCAKVSSGCKNCYAEVYGNRFGIIWGQENRKFTSDNYWSEPYRWNQAAKKAGERRRVFCGSLCDVFERGAMQDLFRAKLFGMIYGAPNLDWLLLTKRPENIPECLPSGWSDGWPNVWLGTSCENQAMFEQRAELLGKIPATVRFLSCEPLLESITLSGFDRFNWVIVGGESGPKARPMHPDWVRTIRDQCQTAETPLFFKQWGEWNVFYDRDRDDPDWRNIPKLDNRRERWLNMEGGLGFHGDRVVAVRNVGKKIAGRELDGIIYGEFPNP